MLNLIVFLLQILFNPLTSPGEGVTVFTSPYLKKNVGNYE